MAKKTISNTFMVNTIEDGVTYDIVWTDYSGTVTQFPCLANGRAKGTQQGIGTDAMLTAMLYQRIGDGTASPYAVPKTIMRTYLANGQEVQSAVWPVTRQPQGGTSYAIVENYERTQSTHVKYVVEFYDSNNNMIATSSICRTLDGAAGADGFYPPMYTDEWYAWSNDPTNPPISATWSRSIPSRGNNAYLWKRIQRHELNTSTTPYSYSDEPYEYFRMSGENGTSIRVEGVANAVVDYVDTTLPVAEEGQFGVLENSRVLYEYVNSNWVSTGYTLPIDGYVIVKNSTDFIFWDSSMNRWDWTSGVPVVVDGTSYTEQREGHLWMYSSEAVAWIDLGLFKGQDGRTWYTHIAWATSVDTTTVPITVQGFVTTKLPTDTTHLWMGVLVDENQGQDPQNASQYTWSYTKGVQGERGKRSRFFYYGGVFDKDDSTKLFAVSDAVTPFFQTKASPKEYHVYAPETNPSNNQCTMAQMWDNTETDQTLTPPRKSFNMYPWEMMTNDFKYLISEAVFAEFAHLGGFIISGDWMISQNGTIRGEASTDFEKFGYLVDVEHGENPLVNNGYNFIPYYAVNGQTGEVYMQNATIVGNLKTGSFGFLRTDTLGIRTEVYNPSTNGFILRPDGSVQFNLPYYEEDEETHEQVVTNGYALEAFGGANIVGKGKNIVLNSIQQNGLPKTFVAINGAMKYILSNIARSLANTTDVGEVYIDSDGYVRVRTS